MQRRQVKARDEAHKRKRKQKNRQKPKPVTGKKCPNCGGVLTAEHTCPGVPDPSVANPLPPITPVLAKAATGMEPDNKEDLVKKAFDEMRPPVDTKPKKKPSLKNRVRATTPATPTVKTLQRRKKKQVKPTPKTPPYEHVTREEYVRDIPGFGDLTALTVVSLPGLAYFFNGADQCWRFIHLRSKKVLPFTLRDPYITEKVCARFRDVDWTRGIEWFRTERGKQVRKDMAAYIKQLQTGSVPNSEESGMTDEREDEAQEKEEQAVEAGDVGSVDDVFGEDEDLGFDLPDIPTGAASTQVDVVEDTFKAAYKFSLVGLGHGGSRIVEAFDRLGYRRAFVVNTSKEDLAKIALDEDKKLCLASKGSGKDRAVGAKHVADNYELILDRARRSFGPEFDRVMVCATAGGGTGSGGFPTLVDMMRDLVEALRIASKDEETRVGLIIALPFKSERSQQANAVAAMRDVRQMLEEKKISPVIVIDNERIRDLHPQVTMGQLMPVINGNAASLFHMFNRLAVMSGIENMDPEDYRKVLAAGVAAYGAMEITSTEKADLSQAFRENMSQNMLTGGVDYKTAKFAACCLAGSTVEDITAMNVDHAFETLSRVVNNVPVFRGVYKIKKDLAAYTFAGGIDLPKERMEEIAKAAGESW